MKTKNLYYAATFKRTNVIKVFILNFFLAISSWPRVFIEVFTRKNQGERYFLMPLCILLTIILCIFPFAKSYGESFFSVVGKYLSWYAYTIAFIMFSYKRYLEVKREPGVYDFAKFSLSPGIIHPTLREFEEFDKRLTSRKIAIYIEPGIFLIAGIILILLKQNIGFVLAASAVIYSFSWSAQYYLGDQFIMDTIDEMICNEELVESFVHGRNSVETKGFEVYAEAPKDHNFRRKVATAMFEEEPAVDVL